MSFPILAAVPTLNRLWMVQACWAGLVQTTQPGEVEVWFVDNGSTDGTLEWLQSLARQGDPRLGGVLALAKNYGTARAINRAWRDRSPGQACLKLDSDVAVRTPGWIPRLLDVFERVPRIAEVGLKRRDLAERAQHPAEVGPKVGEFFLSKLYELASGEVIEVCNHIMGSCVLFSPAGMEALGDLYQMQDEGNLYGFDDALASLRLRLAGFQVAFLRGVEVEHVDPGESAGDPTNSDYTRWKIERATRWMPRYDQVAKEFAEHTRPIRWLDRVAREGLDEALR